MGAAIEVFEGALHDRGRPRPLRPGEDDRRPARAALRRLRPRPATSCSTRPATRCRSCRWTATSTSWSATSTSASPRAPRRCARPSRSPSRATGPSATGVRVVGDVALGVVVRPARRGRHRPERAGPGPGHRWLTCCRSPTTSSGSSPRSRPLPAFPQPLMEALGPGPRRGRGRTDLAAELRQLRDGRLRRGRRGRRRRERGHARSPCPSSARSAPASPRSWPCRRAPRSRS